MRGRIGTAPRMALSGAALSILLAAGTTALAGQDLSGTWVFSVDLGATGAGDATLVIVQDGSTLTGTYSGAVGEHEIHGSVTGDRVEIHFEVDQLGVVSYSGKVTDSGIEGTCEYGEMASGTFKARRRP